MREYKYFVTQGRAYRILLRPDGSVVDVCSSAGYIGDFARWKRLVYRGRRFNEVSEAFLASRQAGG